MSFSSFGTIQLIRRDDDPHIELERLHQLLACNRNTVFSGIRPSTRGRLRSCSRGQTERSHYFASGQSELNGLLHKPAGYRTAFSPVSSSQSTWKQLCRREV
ncbi:hypothetical protein [Paraburkholderia bannensis]|uniref:hypothetical protein n=1 Tax=Paraburkholderia bannensis TaxID=765414 RepID=UPI002AC34002|nr:hypothetical protein [Paraburkholderia bannensis]